MKISKADENQNDHSKINSDEVLVKMQVQVSLYVYFYVCLAACMCVCRDAQTAIFTCTVDMRACGFVRQRVDN